MLAFRGHSLRYGIGQTYDPASTAQSTDKNAWSYMIPPAEEDPSIRANYYADLERNGIEARLEPINQGRN